MPIDAPKSSTVDLFFFKSPVLDWRSRAIRKHSRSHISTRFCLSRPKSLFIYYYASECGKLGHSKAKVECFKKQVRAALLHRCTICECVCVCVVACVRVLVCMLVYIHSKRAFVSPFLKRRTEVELLDRKTPPLLRVSSVWQPVCRQSDQDFNASVHALGCAKESVYFLVLPLEELFTLDLMVEETLHSYRVLRRSTLNNGLNRR